MRTLLLSTALASAGCILPISTGAPMPATTVGNGRVGVSASTEAPVLNLLADRDNQNANDGAIEYGAAPAAAATVTLAYGITEDTDLEVAGEGALYFFILPMPTGGSIGLRHHISAGDGADLALGARVGYVSSNAEYRSSSGSVSEHGAAATYSALSAVIQAKHGAVRPLAALNIMPARIHRNPGDAPDFSFKGLATSVTAGVMFVGKSALAGPYLAVTNFYSDRFDNSGFFFSGGLMFAIRPDRNRKPVEAPPPAPPPGTYYGPPQPTSYDPGATYPPPPAPAPGPPPAPEPAPAPGAPPAAEPAPTP
jgi:hypothetical protein